MDWEKLKVFVNLGNNLHDDKKSFQDTGALC